MRDDAFYVYDYGNCCIRETVETTACYFFRCNDLSGMRGGAGGLLAETKMTASTTNTYYAFCDANGNVTEYADAAGTVRGHYEYSPFGEITAQSGDLADTFTHRFSTKPFDVTTGKVHYEFRPNDPLLGRWMSRDPIGINGGLNEYGFVGNNVVNRWDYLGLKECDCTQERIWMEIASMMKQAIDKTKSNPILVDYNWDKITSKAAYYLPVYREFGGYICCDKKRGRVSSTGPYPGTWRFKDAAGNELYSDDPSKLAKGGGVPTMGNIADDPLKQCGEGLTAVAFYHSHPEGPNLSPSDIRFSNENNLPIAGGAVGAKYFWLYNQSYGKIITEY